MDKKELEELLKQFTQEEIKEALSNTTNKKKRRRGKGKRKRNKNSIEKKPSSENKFDDIISKISLSSDEIRELEEAKKSDKGAVVNPNRGNRRVVEKRTFRCSGCGKDYRMFPSQVHNPERWKCNKCIVNGK